MLFEVTRKCRSTFKYTCRTLLGEKQNRIRQLDDLMKFPFKALKVAVINYESIWREGIKEKLQEYPTAS